MSRKPRVLFVDDDASQRTSMSLVLRHSEVEVETAGDGAEAVRLTQERQFDLVLMDVRMPGMNGIEALQEIRRGRDVPVVLITGYPSDDILEQGRAAGAADVLPKPVELERLLRLIRELTGDGHRTASDSARLR